MGFSIPSSKPPLLLAQEVKIGTSQLVPLLLIYFLPLPVLLPVLLPPVEERPPALLLEPDFVVRLAATAFFADAVPRPAPLRLGAFSESFG